MAKGNVVRFEGLPNFRQAGGLNLKAAGGGRVRDGLLYRSANLHFVTTSDVDTLESLGVRTILDLRSTADYVKYSVKGNKLAAARFQVYTVQGGEVKPLKGAEVSTPENSGTGGTSDVDAEGSGGLRKRIAKEVESTHERRHYITNIWSTEQGIRHSFSQMNVFMKLACLFLKAVDLLCGSHLLSKFVSSTLLNRFELWEHYKTIAEVSKEPIATSLRIIASRENLPLLVQCAAGKDRTGIIVALVLGCLGVSQQVIVEDYAESDENLGPVKDKFLSKASKLGFRSDYVRAHPETMAKFLNYLTESYGGIHGYLDSIGFTKEEQECLRQSFLIDQ